MCVCVCVVSPHSLHTSNPTLPSQTRPHYSDSATQPDGRALEALAFSFLFWEGGVRARAVQVGG